MFESPLILIIAAVILFIVMSIFRSIKPDLKRWWQLILPLLVLAAAFSVDYLVETDKENITSQIVKAKDAALARQPQTIINMIDTDYEGQYRYDKRIIVNKCQEYFGRPFAEKIRINSNETIVTGNNATSKLSVTIHFDDASDFASFAPLAVVEVELEFVRRGEDWKIKSVLIKKVNSKEPPKW